MEEFYPSRSPDILCVVDASKSILDTCNYTWTHNTTGHSVASNALRPKDFLMLSGSVMCSAECQVRGRTCFVNPRTVILSHICAGLAILKL